MCSQLPLGVLATYFRNVRCPGLDQEIQVFATELFLSIPLLRVLDKSVLRIRERSAAERRQIANPDLRQPSEADIPGTRSRRPWCAFQALEIDQRLKPSCEAGSTQ